MKVDASFLQVPLTATPEKPAPQQPEQFSERPVDRPHRDEPANNRDTTARGGSHRDDTTGSADFTANTTQSASVGDLLDVIA